MISIAYHCSHEQFAPSHLLRLVQQAEDAGFDAIHSSDHFHPWSIHQGQSGFSLSWIGAAMQATSIPFSMVCSPGQRYHPAIVAQAIATISEMFEGRFSIELGSGEALNERITGDPWPAKNIRNRRLIECVHIIRDLLDGKEVTFSGLVQIQEAKLYSLPHQLPALFCAALSTVTASWAGAWSDGLLTTGGRPELVAERLTAFRNGGGNGKPVYIQYAFSYSDTKEEAINGAMHQWRSNIISEENLPDLYKPEHFDNAAKNITQDDLEKKIDIITNIEELFEKISELDTMQVSRVILHNVNRNQEKFIQDFAAYNR